MSFSKGMFGWWYRKNERALWKESKYWASCRSFWMEWPPSCQCRRANSGKFRFLTDWHLATYAIKDVERRRRLRNLVKASGSYVNMELWYQCCYKWKWNSNFISFKKWTQRTHFCAPRKRCRSINFHKGKIQIFLASKFHRNFQTMISKKIFVN